MLRKLRLKKKKKNDFLIKKRVYPLSHVTRQTVTNFFLFALRLRIFLMALIARGCYNKSSWIECHRNHCLTIKVTNPNTLLSGDSIIAGLARYQTVWKRYFVSLNATNLGIGGDCVENVLWRAVSLPLPSPVQNIAVQYVTNNISTDSPRDIADCIVDVSTIFQRKNITANIIICGLIPCDGCLSVNRLLINKVNDTLKYVTKMVLFL